MTGKISNGFKGSGSFVRPRLRAIGRIALWAVVVLLLIRGAGAVLASPESESRETSIGGDESSLDDYSSAFVVQFARTYLANPDPTSVAGYMAEPASPPVRASSSPGQKVAQAGVVKTSWLDQSRAITIVSCELTDGRVVRLAVPITRTETGTVAVLGAPYLVPGPTPVQVPGQSTEPVSGPDAGAINELVNKFLAAYVSTANQADLAYFVTPESEVRPLGGGFTLAGPPRTSELDDGPTARSVLAAVRVTDEVSGSSYSTGYRLDLVKRERWYVDAIQGAER